MAKTKISEYDSTASNNTDLDNINLQENVMVPSDLNNFCREIMAHLADMNAGTSAIQDTFTLSDPTDDTKRIRFDASGSSGNVHRIKANPLSIVCRVGQGEGILNGRCACVHVC